MATDGAEGTEKDEQYTALVKEIFPEIRDAGRCVTHIKRLVRGSRVWDWEKDLTHCRMHHEGVDDITPESKRKKANWASRIGTWARKHGEFNKEPAAREYAKPISGHTAQWDEDGKLMGYTKDE